MHGYAITAHIQRASAELLRVEEGSLYPALHRMEQDGWVRAEWGMTEKNRQARFYTITAAGKRQLVGRAGELGAPHGRRHPRASLRITNRLPEDTPPWDGIGASRTCCAPIACRRTSSARWTFHMAERADELMAAGMSAADARREARRRFGNPTLQKERTRDADLLTWLESLGADMRYALRALRASPGFALVTILSLGLGIGANTAIFSLINAVVLKTLPVSRPEELVQVVHG